MKPGQQAFYPNNIEQEKENRMFQFKEKSRRVKNMNEVESQPLTWFWYPYIPFGKVTVVHGKESCGKSIFASRLMAACTNQKSLEGMNEIAPGNALYFSADDDLSELVKPRLIEAGAALSRVYAINDMLPVTLGDDSIGQIIESFGIRMMIVDPIQEYLEYDPYQDTPDMIYPIIYKLAQLAKESGCAVVLTAYSDGLGGEQGNLWRNEFAEKISSVLCLERQGAESKEIRLHHEKCILAPEGKSRIFQLGELEVKTGN